MARPRTPIGTFGTIKCKEIAPGVWEARARFRRKNGTFARPRRTGPTSKAAENRLKDHMTTLADEVVGRVITAHTRMGHIADLWLADVEKDVRRGNIAESTYYQYTSRVKRWVKPQLGELEACEVTVMTIDEILDAAWEVSYSTASSVRVVLGGVCGYAVRHGAMTLNPVRSAKRMTSGDQRDVLTLEPNQRRDLLTKLEEYGREQAEDSASRRGVRAQGWLDLPDIMEAMLATGGRIGEVLATVGDSVEAADRTVALDHHLVEVKGEGIARRPKRKGGRQGLILRVPGWSVEMWRRRKLASGGGPLFPTWNGSWSNPSNVTKRIRKACDAVGYEWVTSHVFRKTVGSHLDASGMSNNEIADQLGNTPDVVETSYRAKRVANEKTAAALESLMETGTDGP